MSSLAAGALVIGVLTLVGVPILWLIFRSGPPYPAKQAADAVEFERRLGNPEFAAVEKAAGCALPNAVRLLYADLELVLGQDWHIACENPGQQQDGCHIAYFQPVAPASLRSLRDGDGAWLAFANDGAGDEYLVDLREREPEVVYLQHDSGEAFGLRTTLGDFLRLPRRR